MLGEHWCFPLIDFTYEYIPYVKKDRMVNSKYVELIFSHAFACVLDILIECQQDALLFGFVRMKRLTFRASKFPIWNFLNFIPVNYSTFGLPCFKSILFIVLFK